MYFVLGTSSSASIAEVISRYSYSTNGSSAAPFAWCLINMALACSCLPFLMRYCCSADCPISRQAVLTRGDSGAVRVKPMTTIGPRIWAIHGNRQPQFPLT